MSTENNVVNFSRIKNLTRDDALEQLERCQMAAEVTLPATNMTALLTQLIDGMDSANPQLKQQLVESQRECAALAAELSVVEAIHNEAVFITDDHYEQCPHEVQKIIRSLAVMQIPAYKAFLAEVRAQGVEQLATLAGNECKRYKSVNDRDGVRKWKSIVILCSDFAAQIRKGVQS